jgi:diguanylate cyclase
MIWDPIGLIIISDVLIVSAVVYLLTIFVKYSATTKQADLAFGMHLILFGLILITLFYSYDLLAIFALQLFTDQEDALVKMADIRHILTPPVILVSIVSISIGFSSLIKSSIPQTSTSAIPDTFYVDEYTSEIKAINVALKQKIKKYEQAQENLQGSEFKLDQITDAIPGAVYQFVVHKDGEYYYEFFSHGVETLLGLTRTEAVNDPDLLRRISSPESIKQFSEKFQGSTKIHGPRSHDLQISTPIGKLKWIRVTATPDLPGEDNRIVWNGIMTDITESKQAEEELKERDEQLSLVMSVTNDGWFDWDVPTNSAYFDPRYYTMAGYEPNEFPGSYEEWAKRVHPEDIAESEKAINVYLVEEIPEYDVEFRFRRKEGEWMWIRGRIKIISRDENGAPLRAIGTHTDITERKRAEEELQKSQALYRQAEKLGQLGHWEWDDVAERMVYCSEQLANIFEMSVEEALATSSSLEDDIETVHPDDREYYESAAKAANERQESVDIKYRIITKSGAVRHVHEIGETVLDENGKIIRSFGTLQDVTESKRAEEALQKSEQIMRDFAETASHWFWEIDADLRMVYLSERFSDVTGMPVEEVVGLSSEELEVKRDMTTKVFDKLIDQCQDLIPFEDFQYEAAGPNGERRMFSISGKPILDADGKFQGYRGTGRDITKAHRLVEQMAYQASHDSLTGLVNRREFESRLTRVLQTSHDEDSEHAVCYMDLDQFKIINDTCGHKAGDELLRRLSQQLEQNVRKRDTLARLGGDEFGLLMEHCNLQQATRVAEVLRKTVDEFRFQYKDKVFGVGVSIGLVPITDSTVDISEILSTADSACYEAKDQGRNRIQVFNIDDERLTQRNAEMQWVSQINRALEEDRFCLYYQTIMPVTGHEDEGEHYELLLRMRDEQDQIIPPGTFLVAAECYNLSPQLDRWVIDKALNWLMDNPDHLQKLAQCSINLSGLSLGDHNFLNEVVELFKETQIPPAKICFEITETAAIANLSSATVFIKTLKELGCKFALDDFGSGLSSYAYLKTLPVDYLKIDGTFVKDILNDQIDFEMVKSINDIGHIMGKQTIAEFVESEEILKKLKGIKVDYAQGFGIGKPQPIETKFPLNAPLN